MSVTETMPLSYVCGPSTDPLVYETIGNAFDRIAAAYPDRLAIVSRHQNIRWTYAEFQQEVDGFAAGLLTLGLEQGDRIGSASGLSPQKALAPPILITLSFIYLP